MRTRDGRDGYLLEHIGDEFTLLYAKNGAAPLVPDGIKPICIGDDIIDAGGLLTERLDATPGAAYLVRPDQHLCARWRAIDPAKIKTARDRAFGKAA